MLVRAQQHVPELVARCVLVQHCRAKLQQMAQPEGPVRVALERKQILVPCVGGDVPKDALAIILE